jgi:hypothetical protein
LFGDTSYVMVTAYDAALKSLVATSPRVGLLKAASASTSASSRSDGSGDGVGPVVVLYTREAYLDVASKLGLNPSEARVVHKGVILARRGGRSAAGGGAAGSGGNGWDGSGSSGGPLWAHDRVFLVDRRQGAWLLRGGGGSQQVQQVQAARQEQEQEAWVLKPGAEFLNGQRGQSCEDRCRRANKKCEDGQLEFANDCGRLMAAFPCEGGCGHQIGDEIPAYVPDRGADTFGQCLTTEQKMPKCRATHRSTARLCVCL